jgi:glycyl-tRNA synthetase
MQNLDKIVSLCKRRGFIFPSSEIYGGLSNTWDYGPYGVELKNNVKKAWWRRNVHLRDDVYGMDAAILMNSKTWEASGHVDSFFDVMLDCQQCKKRIRIDELSGQDREKIKDLEVNRVAELGTAVFSTTVGELRCKDCGGELGIPRKFNLMFKTFKGPLEEEASLVYLRPETAQGMFVNYLNILDSIHPKLPFGLAQIGKAFRNEITPGNFTFRMLEFEQMEIEYFVDPKDAEKFYEYWVSERHSWYIALGIRKENLRKRPHSQDELAHYALACTDIEYKFPFGWSELEGIANRTDYDLRQHAGLSGRDLRYFDDTTKRRFYPFIIEPSGGIDRSVLAFLVDAYREQEVKGRKRVVLSLHKELAPVKVAVFPLLANRAQLVELARKISQDLKEDFVCVYDDTAAIGKLYRRQDEVGTPFCVTVDVESLEDKKVTIRDRDTMQQERINAEKLRDYFDNEFTKDI